MYRIILGYDDEFVSARDSYDLSGNEEWRILPGYYEEGHEAVVRAIALNFIIEKDKRTKATLTVLKEIF